MENIKKDDPISLAKYAQDMKLTNQTRWKWANTCLKKDKRFTRMLKQVQLCKKKTATVKCNFGVRIPKTIKEALMSDKLNGNTKWADATLTELKALYEDHNCFTKVNDKDEMPIGHKCMPLLWVFAVKFDDRHRARCVAGGHVTEDLEYDVYSGVVDLETVKIALVVAILTELKVIAADIGSAYIQAITVEKSTQLQDQNGHCLDWKGQFFLSTKHSMVQKQVEPCGTENWQTISERWDSNPVKADFGSGSGFWIREQKDHHECLAVIVDDLLIFSKDGFKIIEHMKKNYGYEFKGVGKPKHCNGADFQFSREGFPIIHCKTYIANVCDCWRYDHLEVNLCDLPQFPCECCENHLTFRSKPILDNSFTSKCLCYF